MDAKHTNGDVTSSLTCVNKHLATVELQSRPRSVSVPTKPGNFPNNFPRLYDPDSCVSIPEKAASIDRDEPTEEVRGLRRKLRKWRSSSEPASSWIALFVFIIPSNIIIGCDIVSFSVYYVAYAQHFVDTSRLVIGIIYALKMSCIYFAGIVTSVLIARYGCRRVSMTGGAIMFATLFISSFVNHVYILHITHGFLLGVGMSFCLMGINISIQKRFNKNRALASGISMLGLTLGNSISGPLFNLLIDQYSWRGSLLIHGAIMANLIPLSMTLVADHSTAEDPVTEQRTGCCTKVRTFLCDIFDFSLMKNVPFLLVCLGGLLDRVNLQTFMAHMPSRAVHLGMTSAVGATFITSFAIGNAVTRTMVTFISNLKGVNVILIQAIGVGIGALSSTIIVATKGYIGQTVGSVLNGVHVGLTNTVAVVMLVDLLGVDCIGRAFGLYNMWFCISGLVTAPLGGLLYDVTGDYDPPFILATVAGTLATALVITAVIIQRKQRNVKTQEDKDTTEQKTFLTDEADLEKQDRQNHNGDCASNNCKLNTNSQSKGTLDGENGV